MKVDIVLPVLNEEKVLEASVRKTCAFVDGQPGYNWRVTIADNGSTDRTLEIANRLSNELSPVGVYHVAEAGRGRALTHTWLHSDADILAYMDIDLSTDLNALPRLVGSIASGRADIAAGSRLSKESQTTRSLKREVLSRGFVTMINLPFGTHLNDTQCGFKAASRNAAQRLLPMIQDTGWFWDTELLLMAEKGGWNVEFVPVRWVEDTDSRVKIFKTVWRDMKGLARMWSFDWSRAAKSPRPATAAGSRHQPAA